MKCENFDIVIAGSGLTGLSASIALSKAGFKIALVDPKPFKDFLESSYDSRTTALSCQAADFYNEINIWKPIKKYTCPINNILVEEPSTNAYSFLNKTNNEKNTLGFMIQNKNFFKVLLEKVKKNKNIKKFDDKIISFDRNSHTIFTRLKRFKLSSSLLIAADGKNSSVRNLANIKTVTKDYNQKAFVFNIKHQHSHENLATENFLEFGPLASLPLKIGKYKNYSSIVWSCNFPHYLSFKNNEKKFLENFLEKNLNNCYGKAEIISSIKNWNLSLSNSKKYLDHRILLLGDSAHSIHPIAGQSFNLTLRGLKKLFYIAKYCFLINSDIGDTINLRSYNTSHYLDAKLLIIATDKLNTLFSNSHVGLRILRRNGIRIFNKMNLFKNVFKNYASRGKISIN